MDQDKIIELLRTQVERAKQFLIQHNKKDSMLGAVLNNRIRHYPEQIKEYLKNTPIPRSGYTVTLGIYNLLNGIKEYPRCTICGKEVHRFKNILEGWYSTCCKECSMLETYGVTNTSKLPQFKEKFINTNKERYGGMGYGVKEIREKGIETIKRKYGQNYREVFNEKAKQTQLVKYGATHIMKTEQGVKRYLASRVYDQAFMKRISETYTPEKTQKIANSRRNNYLNNLRKALTGKFQILTTNEEYKGFRNRKLNKAIKYKVKCLKCNTIFETVFRSGLKEDGFNCPSCKVGTKSYAQHRFIEKLREIYPNILFQEDRLGILNSRKELDIYCPQAKLAIEYNGNCWHAERYNNFTKYRHMDKFKEALDANIDFLAFWSDQFIRNRFRIYGMIDMLLGNNPIKKLNSFSLEQIIVDKNQLFVDCDKAIQIKENNNLVGYIYLNENILVDFYLMENINKDGFNNLIDKLSIKKFHLENRFRSYYKRWMDLESVLLEQPRYHTYRKTIRSLKSYNKEKDIDKIWNYGYFSN